MGCIRTLARLPSRIARDLLAHVIGVLASEHRPFRVDAVAVEAVAGCAGGGLGGAGGGVPGFLRQRGSGPAVSTADGVSRRGIVGSWFLGRSRIGRPAIRSIVH